MLVQRAAFVIAALAAAAVALAQLAEKFPLPSDVGRTPRRSVFRIPKTEPIVVRETAPLRVDRIEVHRLAEGTHAGAPGDVLVTFHGGGFLETAKAPRVELDRSLTLDDTMVSADGSELFLVLTPELARRIEDLRFAEIAVVNPGGLERAGSGRATVRITPRALVRPEPGAAEARLVFRGGFFQRELTGP